MMLRFPSVSLVLMGLVSVFCRSAAGAEPMALSYEAALRSALERNPTLMVVGLDLESAEGALLAAQGTFDPAWSADLNQTKMTNESTREFGEVVSQYQALDWGSGLSQFFPTGTTANLDWSTTRSRFKYELRESGIVVESETPVYQTRLAASVSQPLLEGHRLAYNLQGVRSARSSRDAAELDLMAQRQQTLADVANAYWDLYSYQRLAEIAADAVRLAEEEQRLVHARVELGELASVEKSRVDAAVVQAQSDAIDGQHLAETASDALLLLMGEAPDRAVLLTSKPLQPQGLQLDEAAVVDKALAENPTILAMRLAVGATEDAMDNARHARLPELAATASYAMIGYETDQAEAIAEMFSGELPEWIVGATLSMPLGNRADRGGLVSAKAAYAKSQIELRSLEQLTAQEVRSQVRTIVSSQLKVELAATNLRLAEETLAAERALREAGRGIQKDVLESMTTVQDARVGLETARADLQLAVIELERLEGAL